MKVTETKEVSTLREAGSKEPVARTAARREAGQGEERVSVTESAEFNTAVEEAKRVAGQSRAARLESLKAAIKQGHYRPDAQRIADEILDAAALNAQMRALLMK